MPGEISGLLQAILGKLSEQKEGKGAIQELFKETIGSSSEKLKAMASLPEAKKQFQEAAEKAGERPMAEREEKEAKRKFAEAQQMVSIGKAPMKAEEAAHEEWQYKKAQAEQKREKISPELQTAREKGLEEAQSRLQGLLPSVQGEQKSFLGKATEMVKAGKGGELAKDIGIDIGGEGFLGQATRMISAKSRAVTGDVGGMMDLGKERIAALGGVASGIGGAIKGERMGEVGSQMFSAVGSLGMAAGGPVGLAVAGLSKFGEVVMGTIDKLRDWGTNLHNANMKFAEFSGGMAAVQGRQEVRDIMLSQERGGRRAESAESLAQGRMRLEKAAAPWEDAWASIKNEVVGWGLDQIGAFFEFATEMFKMLPFIGDAAKKYMEDTKNKESEMYTWMEDVEKMSKRDAMWQRPNRHQR